MTSRIGLLGGTFDPVHNGHIAIAEFALNKLNLNKLLITPAGNPWQKEKISSFKDRFEMTKLAFTEYKNIEISDLESDEIKPTFTYETLEKIKLQYENSEIILLIGSDAISKFDSWEKPNIVKSLARIYVIPREGDFVIDWRFDRLDMPKISISSTFIREKVKNSESIKNLVPVKVAEYIEAHNLYK